MFLTCCKTFWWIFKRTLLEVFLVMDKDVGKNLVAQSANRSRGKQQTIANLDIVFSLNCLRTMFMLMRPKRRISSRPRHVLQPRIFTKGRNQEWYNGIGFLVRLFLTWRHQHRLPVALENVSIVGNASAALLLTRKEALKSLVQAVKTYPGWKKPQDLYGKGSSETAMPAPPPPIKFLDIATPMGCQQPEALLVNPTRNLMEHPWSGPMAPTANPFLSHPLAPEDKNKEPWRNAIHCGIVMVDNDFRTVAIRWGLLLLAPSCPRKLFVGGPWLSYVDIVTDLNCESMIPLEWNKIANLSLPLCQERERKKGTSFQEGESNKLQEGAPCGTHHPYWGREARPTS